MDTIISRMMQLLGVIVVGSYVASALIAAQLKDFEGCIAFMVFGVISAGAFTAIWAISTLNMASLLGKEGKRADITKKHIVGISVGVLALLTCAGFFTAGVSATNGTDNANALWLEFLGSASTAILCIGWCWAEYAFVEKLK